MKIHYKHLLRHINSQPTINELSEKLFQLGHEHDIDNDVFDIEFTPNRGDCLSIIGLLRDLNLFYDTQINLDIYQHNIEPYPLNFTNNAKHLCNRISFLKVEIDKIPTSYSSALNDYFEDLDIKKINFFTDISNYISYETGQPTHCYESSKINDQIRLDFSTQTTKFETLLDKIIEIRPKNLIFLNERDEIINLAGIMGGKNTACSKNTKSVVIECAHFDPESIIGKSVKYDLTSEAAHKFERSTDPNNHNFVLKRFLELIDQHTKIKRAQLFTFNEEEIKRKKVLFDLNSINKILGSGIKKEECIKYLKKLGFDIEQNSIVIPSYRSDISSLNDIAEEVARAIGYDNIKAKNFFIPKSNKTKESISEIKLKNLLIEKGFFEVINNPFVSNKSKNSIIVDNPLDSNKQYLRTDLKESLIKNLQYNERRQNEIIKLFEIADVYYSGSHSQKRICGIIASGRVNNNFIDFSKKIDNNYIEDAILSKISFRGKSEFIPIERDSIDSKLKNHISYIEIEIDESLEVNFNNLSLRDFNIHDTQYIPISDFPSSTRDLSFSVKDFNKCEELQSLMLNIKHSLLKEIFVFDYYKNDNLKEIKIGFRLIFQSHDSTITDSEVNEAIDHIIFEALKIKSVNIPGLN